MLVSQFNIELEHINTQRVELILIDILLISLYSIKEYFIPRKSRNKHFAFITNADIVSEKHRDLYLFLS